MSRVRTVLATVKAASPTPSGLTRPATWLVYVTCRLLVNLACSFPFQEYMSRDRFLGILRCLHYSRVDTPDHPEPANNRSFKIQNIVEYFNNKMRQIYYPDRELTIDEEMVLWRGRLVFRQYVKGKRHKYGIKIYSLNEPEGLMLRFHVYTGSHDSCSGKGHTVKVVMKLMRDFLGKGHSLFMDNFYNSFVLSSKLLRHSTYTTGTLRIDRLHTPPAVKAKALGKGETIANYAQSVMIGKWRDKRTVTYISTQYDNEMVQTTNRRNQKRTLPKPIMYYNSYMKGTDRLDQMVSYYPCERKTLRWHKKIFVHFLQVVVVNSFYLYNMYNSDRLSLYDFRVRVLEDLLPPKEAPLLITPTRNSMHRLSKSMKRKGNGKSISSSSFTENLIASSFRSLWEPIESWLVFICTSMEACNDASSLTNSRGLFMSVMSTSLRVFTLVHNRSLFVLLKLMDNFTFFHSRLGYCTVINPVF
ncbi:piggyBac transposable element-derived protein 4-like [Homalodisca vitripennis]|uniref:piggyBac transposable element-derived protein 4-like n=1 Tax=Homalodisca vitripennis TaxID=197043 RepID=UPI001EEB6B1C|nr:piggyBac transposable element-derived protein 4-like [Homalodisca vitripennis]